MTLSVGALYRDSLANHSNPLRERHSPPVCGEQSAFSVRLKRISGVSGFHRQDYLRSLLNLDLALVPFTRQRLPMIVLLRSSCSTLLANCRAHLRRLLLVLLVYSLSQKHPFLHHGKHKPSLRQKHHVVSTTWESRWHTCSL
jgi:hypothetical protein